MRKNNRLNHFIGGFLIGMCALSAFNAIYSTAVAASAWELKNRLQGRVWDGVDWFATFFGGLVAALSYWLP